MSHILVETILIFDGKYQQKDLEKYSLIKYMERYGNIYFSCPAILTQQLAYWSLIHSIRKRLRVMNDILERATENERRNLRRIFTDTEKTVRNKAYNGNLNIHSRKTPHGDIHNRTTDISDIIQLMMTVHEHIYKCMVSINRFFDYPVLLIIINCIMELIINPWILLSEFKFEESFSFLIPVTWAIIHVVQLFMLIEPIHQLLSEHNETKLLIAQLLKIVKDPRAMEQVERFALQYQLCSLKFTAVDMVILGRSLYTRSAMVAGFKQNIMCNKFQCRMI
ncbi:hypothetical protein WA026_019634 [Henosepilachna vigintioctopunctata]|uniref:Gustatory receptor n=1 Tax=Henosepilachna vigintioctopunctata TaxID=420089 RepID=A0AAW1TMU5_9CUCU